MKEKELQLSDEQDSSGGGVDLSDDDLAAALGLMTTLSEKQMNPMGEDDLQETDPESNSEEREEKTEGEVPGGNIDTQQQKEIDDIRAELEALKHDTASETTENPGTAQ